MASVTWINPVDGGVVGLPFTVILQVSPDLAGRQVDVEEPATGALLGSVISDPVTGIAVLEVTSWVGVAARAAAVSASSAATSGSATAKAGASILAAQSSLTSSAVSASAGVTASAATSTRTAAAADPTTSTAAAQASATAATSTATSASATISVGVKAASTSSAAGTQSATIRAGVKASAATSSTAAHAASPTTTAGDTTAPSIGTFTVPSTATSTALTGIAVAGTDAVGIIGWMLKDVAGGASAPTATKAEILAAHTVASTTSLSLAGQTHTAGGTGARDVYLFLCDASTSGNVARSSAQTCTVSAGGAASVSDDFNRANGGLGANWTTITGKGAPAISGNAAVGSNGGARYSGATFSADQYAESTSTVAAGGDGVVVRCAAAAQTYYYALRSLTSSEADGILLYKRVAGTATLLGEAEVPTYVLGLEVVGTTLRVFAGASHGSLTEVLSVTDASIASGSPGIFTSSGGLTDAFYAEDR